MASKRQYSKTIDYRTHSIVPSTCIRAAPIHVGRPQIFKKLQSQQSHTCQIPTRLKFLYTNVTWANADRNQLGGQVESWQCTPFGQGVPLQAVISLGGRAMSSRSCACSPPEGRCLRLGERILESRSQIISPPEVQLDRKAF